MGTVFPSRQGLPPALWECSFPGSIFLLPPLQLPLTPLEQGPQEAWIVLDAWKQ